MAALGQEDTCTFCSIMLAVPAATACADAGDLDDARQHLAAAERSAALWKGTAWQAAIAEARAHLHRAEGDHDAARRQLARGRRAVRRRRPAARRRPLPGLTSSSAGLATQRRNHLARKSPGIPTEGHRRSFAMDRWR